MKTRRLTSWISLVVVAQLGVASTARGQAPQAAPPAPQPSAPAPQPYAPAPAPYPYPPPQPYWPPPAHWRMLPVAGPVVQLSSDDPGARLQTLQFKWRDVCVAPCGLSVDPGAIYRIGGGTIRPSSTFTMPRAAGTVLVTTETGSTVKHFVGLGMGIGGLVVMGLGGFYLALADETESDFGGGDFFRGYGISYLVIGGILTAIGIPLWLSSTSVTVQ